MSFDLNLLLIETFLHKMTRYVLILMFCVISKASISQTADFTFTPSSSLCTPQEVVFTQTSSGNPTSFVWDFGNGMTGNEPVETIIYDQPGTFTVTLVAVYINTAVTTSKTITINQTPEVTISANKLRLCKPGPVRFSVTGSTSVTSWEWNFGDGSSPQVTSANSVDHVFNTYDSFRIVVKGNTPNGCTMTAAISILVEKFELTGVVDPVKGCIPINANFNITASMIPGDTRQSILWQFGDGTPEVLNNFASFTHRYNTTANITDAKVTVTTAQGCTNEFLFPAFAFGIPPTSTDVYTVSGQDTFCASESIQFFATAVNANLYTWDFNGVIRETPDNTITHRFSSLETKKVIVTPSFNGCNGPADSLTVYIKGVVAKYDITNSCAKKNDYRFVNNSLGNISHYEWTYSDQPAVKDSSSFHGVHTFPVSGTFTSDLLLIDSISGCRDSLKYNIYTATPVLSSSDNIVCRDSLVVYNVGQSYPQNVGFTYEYHVAGDTITNGDTSFLNYYPTAHGINQDLVIIYDSIPGTCSDTILLSELTKVRGPVTQFEASSFQCADTAVSFTNTSFPFLNNEPIQTYSWNFGDGSTDTARIPEPHNFPYGGSYDIILRTKDINGCENELLKTVVIHPIPIVNILPKSDTICSGTNLQLIAYSSDKITWSPAGNICATCDTINISPVNSTNYIALATSEFGCKKRDTSVITVYAPFNLIVTPADTSICPGGSVAYSLNKNGSVTWSPSTYLNNNSSFTPVSTPSEDIRYKVTVTDSAGCYTDSAFANIIVHDGPSVNAGSDLLLDYETPYTLSPVYSGIISEYLWSPGDSLSCSDCATASGIIRSDMFYTIRVTDNNGCMAEDQIAVLLNCENSKLWFPSAFTPNGDGLNDHFHPLAKGINLIKRLAVYNRAGSKVFERMNFSPHIPSLGWDGRSNGNVNQSTQTFVWMAEYECLGKTILRKGTIILVR